MATYRVFEKYQSHLISVNGRQLTAEQKVKLPKAIAEAMLETKGLAKFVEVLQSKKKEPETEDEAN